MKNKKICPKCGSKDILFIPGSVDYYGAGNNIRVGLTYTFGAINVNRYVCCNCGFSEEWIDLEDIPKLKNKYE